MAMQPSVLILDKFTSQLDPIAASDFLATTGKINRALDTVADVRHGHYRFPGGRAVSQGSAQTEQSIPVHLRYPQRKTMLVLR